MNCEEIGKLTPDLLAGNVDRETAREARDHLAACGDCRAEVESLGQIWQRLGLVPDEEPSARLRSRFYAALHELERGEAARPGRSLRARWGEAVAEWWERPGSRRLATTAASLVFGLVVGLLAGGRTQRVESEALRGQVETLRELVAVSLLRADSASTRLQGVSYGRQLATVDERVLEALVEAATGDASANVRLAAIEALGDLGAPPAVRGRLARSLDETAPPLVQMAVVDLLMAEGPAAREELGELMRRPTLDEAVRQYLTTLHEQATY